MKLNLYEYIFDMSRMEMQGNLFKPEYLRMASDEKEAARVCEHCGKSCKPGDYCIQVQGLMQDKELILSFSNRMIHALLERGCWITPCSIDIDSTSMSAYEGEVKFYWNGKHGEALCRKCKLKGKSECPEDVHKETCARKLTVRAIEQIVSTVNELLEGLLS